MSGRSDLRAAAALSLALHAGALGALGRFAAPASVAASSEHARSEPMELVAISPQAMQKLLGATPEPGPPRLREAARPAHGPDLLAGWRVPLPATSEAATAAGTNERVPIPRIRSSCPTAGSESSARPRRLASPPRPASVSPPASVGGQGSVDLEHFGHLLQRRAAVDYPVAARRAKIEGTVIVEMQVGNDGRVTQARVVGNGASSLLERAALAALSRWRFDPDAVARSGLGRTFHQSVEFRLK